MIASLDPLPGHKSKLESLFQKIETVSKALLRICYSTTRRNLLRKRSIVFSLLVTTNCSTVVQKEFHRIQSLESEALHSRVSLDSLTKGRDKQLTNLSFSTSIRAKPQLLFRMR